MISSDFEYAESRWQDIFLHLQREGFDVYPPGEKVGECQSEYVVVKNNGGSKLPRFSTNSDLYTVMCYVPKNKYSTLENFVQRVKNSMDKLKPMILSQGNQTPSYFDDSYKAHMVSMGYKNYKKL